MKQTNDPRTTVRWSNFERRSKPQKWEFSWKVHKRPFADIILNESLPPNTTLWTSRPWPPWSCFSREKSLKSFKVSYKIRNFERNFKILYLAGKWVWRAQIGLVWMLVSRATHYDLQKKKLVGPSTEEQRSHERAPQNVEMTLKVQSFVSKFKVLFVGLPGYVWPSNFWNCLKMPQR
jgi:hypothetical protein